MALRINKALTTKSGLPVPSGAYVWLLIKLGGDLKYKAECHLFFYKDKASFDTNPQRIDPVDIADTKKYFEVVFTPQQFGSLTSLAVHEYVQDQLNVALGGNFVEIVA